MCVLGCITGHHKHISVNSGETDHEINDWTFGFYIQVYLITMLILKSIGSLLPFIMAVKQYLSGVTLHSQKQTTYGM